MAECRFCSKRLHRDYSTINEEIKNYFNKITQMELLESDICSNYVCELCLRSLQLANALRVQLLENEQKLYELFEKCGSPGMNCFESGLEYNDASGSATSNRTTQSSDIDDTQNNNTIKNPSNVPSNAGLRRILPKTSTSGPKNLEISISSTNFNENNRAESIVQIKTEKGFETESSEVVQDQFNVDIHMPETIIKEEPEHSIIHINDFSNDQCGKIQVNKEIATMQLSRDFGPFTDKKASRPASTSNSFRSSEKVLYKNNETNQFECTHCSFTTDSQSIIKNHVVNSHQGEISCYKCPHCDSSYFKGSNLKRHILSKHMNHRFCCVAPDCNVKFQDRSSLRRHIVTFHGRVMPKDQLDMLISKTKRDPCYVNLC